VKNKLSGTQNIQPLIVDLSNPSPAIGVNNEEHASFLQRCHADLVMALALIHHLVIGKNIPFEKMVAFFSQAGNYLIIEYIPKQDEKIQLMLKTKKDIYLSYSEQNFENAFKRKFEIKEKQVIGATGRILYLMKRI